MDDEIEIRRGLQRLITRFGYSVRAAASAEEADQWLGNESFDVCLLDIELPRMKGVEFLGWALGCMLVYSGLAGTGHVLYGHYGLAFACLIPFVGSAIAMAWLVPRILRNE